MPTHWPAAFRVVEDARNCRRLGGGLFFRAVTPRFLQSALSLAAHPENGPPPISPFPRLFSHRQTKNGR